MESVEQNLRQTFEWLAARRPEGEVRETAGLRIASAAASFQMFNAAFLPPDSALSAPELERRIVSAEVHFGARGLDWAFWVCSHLLDPKAGRRARRIFEAHRMTAASDLPAMVADGIRPPRHSLPTLEVRRVGDEQTRLAFCDVGCVCFHVPPTWFREIFLPESVWTGSAAAGYVGYLDGEPIATALTFFAGGVVGIYNVATLPGRRRKGFAEFMMRMSLERARESHGAARSILQSTEQGLPLYTRMGYRTVGRVLVFASEAR